MNQYWILLTTAFVILLMAVSLTSCDFDKKDGDWDPMKWARTDYRETVVDRISYYDVPASGGTFTFRCTNYNSFWLAGTSVKDEKGKTEHLYHEEGDYKNITNSLISERVEGDKLTVRLGNEEKNYVITQARKERGYLTFQIGDGKYRYYIRK